MPPEEKEFLGKCKQVSGSISARHIVCYLNLPDGLLQTPLLSCSHFQRQIDTPNKVKKLALKPVVRKTQTMKSSSSNRLCHQRQRAHCHLSHTISCTITHMLSISENPKHHERTLCLLLSRVHPQLLSLKEYDIMPRSNPKHLTCMSGCRFHYRFTLNSRQTVNRIILLHIIKVEKGWV